MNLGVGAGQAFGVTELCLAMRVSGEELVVQPAVVLEVVFSEDARLLTSHPTTHPLANLSGTWCSRLDCQEIFFTKRK